MKDMNQIEMFARLQKLISLFQRVNQLSWSADQTRKRYPNPELMTEEEVESLSRLYLALGFTIEEMAEDWKEIYNEYKEKTK
jgi:hypothetical protein